jgi:hypothetical protein
MASVARGEATQEVTRLLASIHSLTAELSTSDPQAEGHMVHLRLVLSASELALLPFELANAYRGLAAQEQPLCLQSVRPVCLTREARRVSASTLEWPRDVSILVVAAAPPQVSAVPLREHLEALRGALEPSMEKGDDAEFSQHVTVLEEASLAAVRDACGRKRYTHVHVLAHGIGAEDAGSGESRFGLAFHVEGSPEKLDVVTGSRLAAALRCHIQERGEQKLASPVVLTIASCDSANLGTVIAPGASVAHELHEAGIPLVIGSQFPLSVKGSVVMTGLLYRRLLRGDDPRVVTHDLRQALHAEVRETHDWASLVVYASLPGDIDMQLERARFRRAQVALEVAMARVDSVLRRQQTRQSPEPEQPDWRRISGELKETMRRFEEAAPRVSSSERVSAMGILASAYKRVAEVLRMSEEMHSDSAPSAASDDERSPSELSYQKSLEEARHKYFTCYQAGVRDAWPLVQYLALTVALNLDWRTKEGLEEFKKRWTMAEVMAQDALRSNDLRRQVWAHSDLAELWLLAAEWEPQKTCQEKGLQHIRRMHEIIQLQPYADAHFDMYSFYRQILRYVVLGWSTDAMFEVSAKFAEELRERGARARWTRT